MFLVPQSFFLITPLRNLPTSSVIQPHRHDRLTSTASPLQSRRLTVAISPYFNLTVTWIYQTLQGNRVHRCCNGFCSGLGLELAESTPCSTQGAQTSCSTYTARSFSPTIVEVPARIYKLSQFPRVPISQSTFQMSSTASPHDTGQLITRIRTKCRFLTPTTEES
ncbi:hypothetical protein QL285_046555 [Trifolium repens]|nr:hypothetical protein QL285_046555 [Trifolium repens]